MKTKILTLSLLAVFQVGILSNIAFAQQTTTSSTTSTSSSSSSENTVKFLSPEKLPGANCVCAVEVQKGETGEVNGYKTAGVNECKNNDIKNTPKTYICSHAKGIKGFQSAFAAVVRWIVQIALLLGVLAIAALGVAWAVAGSDDPAHKKFLKDWLINLIIGYIILIMFSRILPFLAPWIYQ